MLTRAQQHAVSSAADKNTVVATVAAWRRAAVTFFNVQRRYTCLPTSTEVSNCAFLYPLLSRPPGRTTRPVGQSARRPVEWSSDENILTLKQRVTQFLLATFSERSLTTRKLTFVPGTTFRKKLVYSFHRINPFHGKKSIRIEIKKNLDYDKRSSCIQMTKYLDSDDKVSGFR